MNSIVCLPAGIKEANCVNFLLKRIFVDSANWVFAKGSITSV